MTELAAAPRRDVAAAAALGAGGVAAIAGAVLVGGTAAVPVAIFGGMLLLGALVVRRPVVSWATVLCAILLVILFVPVRRYIIPGGLPFDLEPYRILVAIAIAGWGASLLVDPRVRLRTSGLEAPIALILAAIAGSIAVNPARATAYQAPVLKGLTLFLSFVLVFYLVVSVVRSEATLMAVVKTLVAGGAVLGGLAVVEARTGFTAFAQLDRVFPFLTPDPAFEDIVRGGTTRASASAEHPIALGAAFALLIPLAIYTVRSAGPRWFLALGALALGVLASGSRTAVVMLVVIGLVFLWLRPRETRRLWPLLVPLLVATHFAVPGALGSLKHAFLPEGGLVAQQSDTAGDCDAAGRVADLGPTLQEVATKPFFGHGFGTRIVTGPDSNACILDNQWLGTLVEVGLVGFLAWLWLLVAVIGRLGRLARADASPRGWLAAATAASVAAYAVGMLTFDALGFTQVTFLLFVVLALGACAARPVRERDRLRTLR